jgi:hypothetical protein
MNLSFPRIWEQDKCGSSDPIGIGALVVKFSYLYGDVACQKGKSRHLQDSLKSTMAK